MFHLFSVAEEEEELDQQEERIEIADARVKELEVEVTQLGNSLRSMEINEGQAVERTQSGDVRINESQKKYEEIEARAIKFEEKSKELDQLCDDAEDRLSAVKSQYEVDKAELDQLLAEINEM